MRNLSLRRFEDAASNKPRSCMLFDIVTRKNAAVPIFTVPRCAAPGMRSGALAIDAASSHAVDSTSAATVVGTGMPIFAPCASKTRVAHDCDYLRCGFIVLSIDPSDIVCRPVPFYRGRKAQCVDALVVGQEADDFSMRIPQIEGFL